MKRAIEEQCEDDLIYMRNIVICCEKKNLTFSQKKKKGDSWLYRLEGCIKCGNA